MKNEKFYIGNYIKESKRKGGWFIGGGHFMNENDLRKDNRFEVKFWEFPPGRADHKKKKQKRATEFTVILRGKIDGEINGEKIKLEAGDYVVIPPGTKSGIPKNVLEYVEGLTVKIPSLRNDKIIIK